MFKGKSGDPKTVKSQVDKVKDRFAISKVVLVGDRGRPPPPGCAKTVPPAKLDCMSALAAPRVKALVRGFTCS